MVLRGFDGLREHRLSLPHCGGVRGCSGISSACCAWLGGQKARNGRGRNRGATEQGATGQRGTEEAVAAVVSAQKEVTYLLTDCKEENMGLVAPLVDLKNENIQCQQKHKQAWPQLDIWRQ